MPQANPLCPLDSTMPPARPDRGRSKHGCPLVAYNHAAFIGSFRSNQWSSLLGASNPGMGQEISCHTEFVWPIPGLRVVYLFFGTEDDKPLRSGYTHSDRRIDQPEPRDHKSVAVGVPSGPRCSLHARTKRLPLSRRQIGERSFQDQEWTDGARHVP